MRDLFQKWINARARAVQIAKKRRLVATPKMIRKHLHCTKLVNRFRHRGRV